eukprot:g4785.t1
MEKTLEELLGEDEDEIVGGGLRRRGSSGGDSDMFAELFDDDAEEEEVNERKNESRAETTSNAERGEAIGEEGNEKKTLSRRVLDSYTTTTKPDVFGVTSDDSFNGGISDREINSSNSHHNSIDREDAIDRKTSSDERTNPFASNFPDTLSTSIGSSSTGGGGVDGTCAEMSSKSSLLETNESSSKHPPLPSSPPSYTSAVEEAEPARLVVPAHTDTPPPAYAALEKKGEDGAGRTSTKLSEVTTPPDVENDSSAATPHNTTDPTDVDRATDGEKIVTFAQQTLADQRFAPTPTVQEKACEHEGEDAVRPRRSSSTVSVPNYDSLVRNVREMGFEDEEKVHAALAAANGSVEDAVALLLRGSDPPVATKASNDVGDDDVSSKDGGVKELTSSNAVGRRRTKSQTLSDGKWRCSRCTLVNVANRKTCAVCAQRRSEEMTATTPFALDWMDATKVEDGRTPEVRSLIRARLAELSLRRSAMEKPLGLLSEESSGQSTLARDYLRFDNMKKTKQSETLRNEPVSALAVDGKWIVVGTSRGAACVLDHFHQERCVLRRKGGTAAESAISAMALSPASDMLMCGYENGDVVLWNLMTSKVMHTLKPQGENNASAAVQQIVFVSSTPSLVGFVLYVSCVASIVRYRTKLLRAGFVAQTETFAGGAPTVAAVDMIDPPKIGKFIGASSLMAVTLHGARMCTLIMLRDASGACVRSKLPSRTEGRLGEVYLLRPEPKWPTLRILLRWYWHSSWPLPMLVQAYGNVLQLVTATRKPSGVGYTPFRVATTAKVEDSIVTIEWIDENFVLLLTASRTLRAYNVSKRSFLVSVDLDAPFRGAPRFADFVSARSRTSMLFAEQISKRVTSLHTVHRRPLEDCLAMFIRGNRWIPALACGVELCAEATEKDFRVAEGLLTTFLYNNVGAGAKLNPDTVPESMAVRAAAQFAQRCSANSVRLLETVAEYIGETDGDGKDGKKKRSDVDTSTTTEQSACVAFASAMLRMLFHGKIRAPSAALVAFLIRHSENRRELAMALSRCSWTQESKEEADDESGSSSSAGHALPALVAASASIPGLLIHVATNVIRPPQFSVVVGAFLSQIEAISNDVSMIRATSTDTLCTFLLFVDCCLRGVAFPGDGTQLSDSDAIRARQSV